MGVRRLGGMGDLAVAVFSWQGSQIKTYGEMEGLGVVGLQIL